MVGGPFGYPPSVNGRPIDPGQNPTPSYTGQREAKVLNDAVLQAALDLARGEPDAAQGDFRDQRRNRVPLLGELTAKC